jgi:hypothetical protein
MRDGRSVDTVLPRELFGFVSAEADWLNHEIPGFLEALAWPDGSNALESTGDALNLILGVSI